MNTNSPHKRLKKAIVICFAIVFIFLVLPAVFPFSLEKVSDRAQNHSLPKEIQIQIENEACGMSIKEVMTYGIKKTARMLRYTEENDIVNGNANCIGYAKVYAGICDYAFHINNMPCMAKPVVGYVMVGDINLCNILRSIAPQRWKGFVADHDFVEFRLEEGDYIYQDACIYDIFRNKCTTTVRKQKIYHGERRVTEIQDTALVR